MRYIRKAAFAMGLSVMIGPASLSPAAARAESRHAIPPASAVDIGLEAKVDAYLQPFLDARGFSGAVLLSRQGRIVLAKGYGMANEEIGVPNTIKTKFQIASVSKSFTAAAVLLLEERGRLALKDPVARFIPDFAAGDRITIHHLLAHTSGIPDVNGFSDYDRQSRFPQTLETIVSWFKNRPLAFAPGDRYQYSNSNYNLLALIIEKASGRSYGAFLKENIFDPLGMRDTGHPASAAALLPGRASGYVPTGAADVENAPYLDWTVKTGNGSLYSTVEDLYRWDRALRTETILSRASLEKAFSEQTAGVGYGWFIGRHLGRRVVTINGRSPGFASYLDRFLDDDASLIILSNNYAPVPHLIAKDLGAILFGERYEQPGDLKPVRLPPEGLDRLSGRYKFGTDFYRPGAEVLVEREGDHLVLAWTATYRSPLLALSPTEFLDRSFWARISFDLDTGGSPSGFRWRDASEYRAEKR